MTKQELGVTTVPEVIEAEGQTEPPATSLQKPASKRSEPQTAQWLNDEYRQKVSEAKKRWWRTHPDAKKRKEAMRKRWQDPQYRERMLRTGKKHSPETRAKLKQNQTARWQNSGYQEMMEQSHRNWWENHPEARKELSATMRERWQDPEYRAMMLRAKEVRKKMREANPPLLTPVAAIDQELWAYARINDLIPKIIETGNIEEEEIARLKNFFEEKGTQDRLPKNLLDRFSIAVAKVAY
jgi:hypothetical protein